MRYYALLVLLCLAAFLPGIATLPPVDRDEPRFMQASRQMAESGDYVDIRFQDHSRYKKPVGIYWLQNASAAVTGTGPDAPIWVYRLVSVLGGIVAVCATFATGRSLFGARAGLIAAVALAGTFGLCFEARIAKTDAVLLATAVIAQGALASLYLAGQNARPAPRAAFWLFWVAEGAAILVKGPIVPLLGALTVAALVLLDRDRRWLRSLKPAAGLAVAALVAAPWIVAISMKSGWAFWRESVGQDMLGKAAAGQESHGFPPGYYVITYSLYLWPFGAAVLEGGLAALRRFRADPRLKFLLAWYVPWWIVCEILPTKLPHYMLPAYPALLLAMAWRLDAREAVADPLPRWQVWLVLAARFGVAVVAVGLAGLALGLPLYFGEFMAWSIPCALAFLAAGWLALAKRPVLDGLGRTTAAAIASLVAVGLLAAKVLPGIDPLWPSRGIAQAFAAAAPCPDSRLVSAGYGEPSLVFLTATGTQLTDGAGAAEQLRKDRCAVAAVDISQEAAFLDGFDKDMPPAVGRVEGFDFSDGRAVAITIYRSAPGDRQ
jgi:4-amino-4-deoxy-L-arabinose transferase-like glycosyltransferase